MLFIAAKTMLHLDDLDKSNAYILDAIKKDSDNKNYRLFKDELDEIKKSIKNARKTFDAGESELAIKEFQKISEKYPDIGIVFYEIGYIYKNLYNFDQAFINYEIAKTNNNT